MANPIPTLMVAKFKGSGNVQVHKLLNGTTLDPTQDGNDVLVGNLEAPSATGTNNHANRLIEAFGKRFLLHGSRVYERDQGGAGNWGVVYTGQGISQINHSGLHLLYPLGVPTLAFLSATLTPPGGNLMAVHSTTDGVTWNGAQTAVFCSESSFTGPSVVFRNSIAWAQADSNGPQLRQYDFALNTGSSQYLAGINFNAAATSLVVHQNVLFAFTDATPGGNTGLYRFGGVTWAQILVMTEGAPNHLALNDGNGYTMFSDGDDLICMAPSLNIDPTVHRISDVLPGGTPSVVSLSSFYTTFPSGAGAFVSYKSVDPSPLVGDQAIYLWYRSGSHNSGSWDLFRFNFRRITHGAVTGGPFLVNERVVQATSGAEGVVTNVGGGFLELTNVVGTFDNTNVITGDDSTAFATATSLLLDQAPTSLGAGISAVNFGVPHGTDGGMERVPAKGLARPQFDGLPIEQLGGARRRFFRTYGVGADVDLKLFFSPVGEAPDFEATITAVAITDTPITANLVGNLGEVALEALSPATGAAYVVSAVDGDSSLTPGALAIAVGDIVEYDGANWTFALNTATVGFPDFATHATLSSTTPLIAPYADGADDGKLVAFDGTSLTGIFVSTPSVAANTALNITPTNGATTFSIDHDATADGLIEGQRHSVMLDIQ